MTGLAFGAAAVMLVFAGISAFTAVAMRWTPETPTWRGAVARRLIGSQGSSTRSLWWVATELVLLGVGSIFAGLSTMPRYAETIWPGALATPFFVAGIAAGVVAWRHRRADAAHR
ncbi:hypothetical protein [Cryptosporangium sp. NPDC048952]|uniref:hypothetical protein n=1 Tax=Cryptosporangium sp. NPDC048952 TaxID=3363961 RepID=UPI00372409E4